VGVFFHVVAPVFRCLGPSNHCEVYVILSTYFTYFDIQDPLAGRQKNLVHDGESTPLVPFMVPTGCDRIPNGVLQPLILALVPRTGRSFTLLNAPGDCFVVAIIIWQYSREDLIRVGR